MDKKVTELKSSTTLPHSDSHSKEKEKHLYYAYLLLHYCSPFQSAKLEYLIIENKKLITSNNPCKHQRTAKTITSNYIKLSTSSASQPVSQSTNQAKSQ